MTDRARKHERAMLIRGAALLVVVAVALTLMFAQARGAFSDDFRVTAKLSSVGDGLAAGADVKYRGVLVGRVDGVDVRDQGGADVRIRLRKQHADGVPANVLVRRVPSNIFAQPSIELADPPRSALVGPTVANGAVLHEDTSKESLEIQTAISKAYDLINALRPEELTVALDALASALDGNGAEMGRILARTDGYLSQIASRRDKIDTLLHENVAAIAVVRRSAPDMLAAVRDALVPARTIATSQAQIRSIVGAAGALTDLTQRFLDRNLQRMVTVVRDLRPVVAALGLNRAALTNSFVRLGDFVAWGPRIPRGADGPVVRLDFRVNPSLLKAYSASDCPRYSAIAGESAMAGPNCGAAARRTTQSPTPGGLVGPVGSAAERAVVHTVTAALAGSTDPAADAGGDASVLLLGPLLRGTTVVSR